MTTVKDVLRCELSSHLDWFSLTFPKGFPLSKLTPWLGDFQPQEYGFKSYKQGFRSTVGALAFSNGPDEMGVHVVMGGEALMESRANGQSDRGWCQFAAQEGAKASRLDVTINVFNSDLKMRQVSRSVRRGWLKSPARVATEDKGVLEPGHTVYIGSPGSDRRARIYDKLAESRIKDPEAFAQLKELTSWLRFEVQMRNERARGVQGAIAYHEDTSEVIKASVRDFLSWNNPVYIVATTGKHVALPELSRKMPALLEWLEKQVSPAIAKFQIYNPDQDVLAILSGFVDIQVRKQTEQLLAKEARERERVMREIEQEVGYAALSG